MGITISKKTYWTTLIYLFSALTNIALCFVLIPPLGISGAAMASALSAILTLLLRTAVGERYYRAILNYRYLALTIGLMTAASLPEPAVDGPYGNTRHWCWCWRWPARCSMRSFVPSGPPPDRCFPALRGHFRKEERHGR